VGFLVQPLEFVAQSSGAVAASGFTGAIAMIAEPAPAGHGHPPPDTNGLTFVNLFSLR
jgi:hypothetical protein